VLLSVVVAALAAAAAMAAASLSSAVCSDAQNAVMKPLPSTFGALPLLLSSALLLLYRP
jgi:hypothetical protein